MNCEYLGKCSFCYFLTSRDQFCAWQPTVCWLTFIASFPWLVVTISVVLMQVLLCRAYWDYSRVPNKRTGRLLENEKKSHLYATIRDYSFVNFQQKVPPICLFPLTLLLIFVLSMAHFDLRRPQKPLWGHIQKLINYKRIFYWNTKQPLLYPIECFQKSHLYVY